MIDAESIKSIEKYAMRFCSVHQRDALRLKLSHQFNCFLYKPLDHLFIMHLSELVMGGNYLSLVQSLLN